MNITICGGGNLGHVCAGFLSAQKENSVSLLTTRPDAWSKRIKINDCKGHDFQGLLNIISDNPVDVIPQADIVLFCLPGFAIESVLKDIRSNLSPSCWVGTVVSSTGFFFEAMKILPSHQPLFGFQRVPFISRIVEYGHSAELKGYKDSLSVAIEQVDNKEYIRTKLEILFKTPISLLNSYYEVSLSNSNPLLHPARLYTLWKEWKPGITYEYVPGFYEEWTLEASSLYISMDKELQALLKSIGLEDGSIPTVLDYYQCKDANELTNKIRSIKAFQGIKTPMVYEKSGSYKPDFRNRYFTEDFPYGMRFIVETGKKYKVKLPVIKRVYEWGESCINNL